MDKYFLKGFFSAQKLQYNTQDKNFDTKNDMINSIKKIAKCMQSRSNERYFKEMELSYAKEELQIINNKIESLEKEISNFDNKNITASSLNQQSFKSDLLSKYRVLGLNKEMKILNLKSKLDNY